MSRDSLISELSQAAIYSKLLNYFERGGFKQKIFRSRGVSKTEEPNLILGRAYSVDVKAEILPKNGGSEVAFSFDFKKIYNRDIPLANFAAIIVLIILSVVFRDFGWFESGFTTLLIMDVFEYALRDRNERRTQDRILKQIRDILGVPQPLPKLEEKPTPKSFLKKCIKCGKEIPIASEECPFCKTKQL